MPSGTAPSVDGSALDHAGNHLQGAQGLLGGGGDGCGVIRPPPRARQEKLPIACSAWGAFHHVVARGAVDMNVEISRHQHGFGKGINGIATRGG
jgi:hypothetical protein